MSFNSKVVLVTGASSGIGAAMALKFAEEGANVAMVGRKEHKLKDVAEKCGKVGHKPLIIVADVTKGDDAKRIVSETLKRFGKLDVLINNAGIGGTVPITADNAMEDFDRVMSTNLRSVVYLTHLASKHLFETKGNIINISSIAGQKVWAGGSYAYCTSKAALDHFTRTMALEFAPQGVRVNSINPGPVRTDIIENMGSSPEQIKEIFEVMKGMTALKRVSDAFEIADLALFLASEKAVGITGSLLYSDNGALVSS